MNNNQNG